MELPKKYDPHEAEERWQKAWIDEGVYKFHPGSDKPVYGIDTPPPTVSGKMHIGHAFSYTHEDIIARYKRMRGFNVLYPFGTDDNGLATERLIERMKKVRASRMDRDEFVKLTLEILEKDLRPRYIQDWKRIGMSCDWDVFYTTMDEHCMRTSQKAFLDLVKKERVYRKEAPVIWCPKCATALSQVEVEDRELDSHFNDITFRIDGKDVLIGTTRPELLPACVAVFFHPEDARYRKLEGKTAVTPLFQEEVRVMADERVNPEKGTGIVMCCTFGDQTDMEWQKAYNLPIKNAFTHEGRMTKLAGDYEGLSIADAREQIIEDLKKEGLLVKQEAIKHAVNVHERCGTEVEFMHSKQWFIKYMDLKDDFLKRGRELNWYPEHMRHRYDNWIKGLQWDWCISRQRFSGVPFPVWYDKKTGKPIYADEGDLPVDPLKDLPKGKKKEDVVPEKDVMDTWATSSLTPKIVDGLFKDSYLPMSLRPQAHDIITFWLFNTVVRSHLHDNDLPWQDVMISGWALDPKGKKMSKSKGNVVEPQEMIGKYSADALRFWAAGSKLGEDLPFQEKDLVTGQKTIVKLWNASKFALMNLEDFDGKKPELEIMDRWLLAKFNSLARDCTDSFEKYEYSRTRLEADNFFWNVFCDYYLEIVKDRLYNPGRRGERAKKSAHYTLYQVLLGILKLLAPIMPHITEEIHSLYFSEKEVEPSIHNSSWPEYDTELEDSEAMQVGDEVIRIIDDVRKFKTGNSMSMGAELGKVSVRSRLNLSEAEADIAGTTRARKVEISKGAYSVDISS